MRKPRVAISKWYELPAGFGKVEMKTFFNLNVMKKLILNKQTIARLNNPDKIYGGGVNQTFSLNAYGMPRATCDAALTCEGTPSKCVCNSGMEQPANA